MSLLQVFPFEDVSRRGSIREADVIVLQQAFENGAALTSTEAEQLIALNALCPVKHPAWGPLIIAALSDYFVHQLAPDGYLNADKAARLTALISREGRIASRLELDVLLGILEGARWTPVTLVGFALDQVRHAIVAGEGPTRFGLALPPGTICEEEVELVRRVLCSFGRDASLAITRREAEALFAIDDVLTASAPKAWTDLFVAAITNFVMSASGHAVPTRQEALAPTLGRGTLLGTCPEPARELGQGATALANHYQVQSYEERAIARLECQRIEIITGEEIGKPDPLWLIERLARGGGRLTPSVQALLARLASAVPAIDPLLRDLAGRLRRAA